MAKFQILAGSTSETIDIFIQDSSSTTGAGLAGLAYNTASLTCYYNFRRGSSTAVTLATLAAANSSWSSGGFKEIDATNQKGKYRFDIPDALLASGNGRYVSITFMGAANMAPTLVEIELVAVNNQDSVRMGMTALPNAAAAANGGLPTGDANAAVKVQAGTGTGQLDFTSGVVKANLAQILGTALTETAGQIAAAFKKFFDIASPTSTMNQITLVSTTTTLTNAPPAPAGMALEASVQSVKDQTDQFVFTNAGQVDSNMRSTNDVRLTGTGVAGDKFRPA